MSEVTANPEPPAVVAGLQARARRFETHYRGRRIVWRAWGRGQTVLLLHGGYGSWTHFSRNIPALAANRRVLAPDMPGFGASDDPADDAPGHAIPAALASGLGDHAEAPWIDVVGFSFGTVMAGLLARRMAESAPQAPRVRRLALCAPAGLGLGGKRFDGLRGLDAVMSTADRLAVHRNNLATTMFADAAAIDDDAVRIQDANVARFGATAMPMPCVTSRPTRRRSPVFIRTSNAIVSQARAIGRSMSAPRR